MAKVMQLIDNGRVYYRVGIGMSKVEAQRFAKQFRRNGNLARVIKKTKKWDVYSHGKIGLGNVKMGR